jgi:hypothetical protein
MAAPAVDAVPPLPQPLPTHAKAFGNKILTLSFEETQPPQLKDKIQQKGEGQMGATSASKIKASLKTQQQWRRGQTHTQLKDQWKTCLKQRQ